MAQVLQLIGLERPQAEGGLLLHEKPLADQPRDAERRCISGRNQRGRKMLTFSLLRKLAPT